MNARLQRQQSTIFFIRVVFIHTQFVSPDNAALRRSMLRFARSRYRRMAGTHKAEALVLTRFQCTDEFYVRYARADGERALF